MKKISFLIGSLGGGGAERVTVALADYFCENGYNSGSCCPDPQP